MSDELNREKLAALAHEQWCGWMKYFFSKCVNPHLFSLHIEPGTGAVVIPKEYVERWMRQMNTAYADLPEREKESDRKEADRIQACWDDLNKDDDEDDE